MALNAVHAWGVRWRFSLVSATKSATMVFDPLRGRPDCCVHLGGVPLPLVQQYRYLGVVLSPTLSWRPHVDFLCSAVIVSFTRPVLGALVKASLSPSRLPFSSLMFSRVLLLVSSSLLIILLPLSSSTSHSVPGVATFSDGPTLPLLLQYTWNLASVMLCTLPLDALSRFSGACVCRPRLPWPSGHCQCVPALLLCARYVVTGARLLFTLSPSRSLPTWIFLLAHSTGGSPEKSVLVCAVPFVIDSLPRYLIYMVSSLTSSLTTSSLSGRTPCTPLTCFRLWALARWSTNTPPLAVPPGTP